MRRVGNYTAADIIAGILEIILELIFEFLV